MITHLLAAAPPAAPPSPILDGGISSLIAIGAVLLLSSCFSLLKASIERSNTARLLSTVPDEGKRWRLDALLDRADSLITSAGILKIACDLIFLILLLGVVIDGSEFSWTSTAVTVALAIPVLLLFTEALPDGIALKWGDSILARTLIPFAVLQTPLGVGVRALLVVRTGLFRAIGVPEPADASREIVEGLRDVVTDTGRSQELDEAEREIIENVMEFRDVDVAAVMTPRTEIHGIEVGEGIPAAVRLAAEEGHSRIPVFEGNLDTIIGSISARGVIRILAAGELEGEEIREHLQPAYFVPETKHISELLAEFRRERQKMAIVLDEYGGTAGIVTMGDILAEIVGEIQEEFDPETQEELRFVEPGVAVIDASLHVSEVNEALETEIPEEEDFETLGGFVLSELGRFPKPGEEFEALGAHFIVLEASDRRVIRVQLRKL